MKLGACIAALGAALLGGCVSISDTAPPEVSRVGVFLSPKDVLVPGNHLYSGAVAHGGTIWLAGVIGRSETGDVKEATREAMDTVKARLEMAGGDMANLLKCTVFMTDIAQYGPMNEVYAEYFESDPPARTAVAVAGLPGGAMVEVECIAAQ